MGTLTLRLPSSLHNQIRLLAKRDGVSINRAKRADLDHYNAALAKVPDVATAPADAL